MERGDDVNTIINEISIENKYFDGTCISRWDDNSTMDAKGHHDSKILFFEE